eukprot:3298034-Prymnesium_polylepis.1
MAHWSCFRWYTLLPLARRRRLSLWLMALQLPVLGVAHRCRSRWHAAASGAAPADVAMLAGAVPVLPGATHIGDGGGDDAAPGSPGATQIGDGGSDGGGGGG